MKEYLPLATLTRLLGALLLVMLPHFFRIPLWETALIAALCLWRPLASRRQWRMPHPVLRIALTLAASAGVYASYGRVTGQHAGVALLVVMLALKLTELKARRDVTVLVFMMYFMMATHFLFSQEIWTIFYLFICAIAITAVLIESSHPGRLLPLAVSLSTGARLILQAVPLMLLLFILFPRVPGPLWGLPSDSGNARSGLSDSMAPGDISRLILSDDIAFRVRFDGQAPSAEAMYWRGPVFWQFDGRTWSPGFRGNRELQRPQAALQGSRHRYELTMEPHGLHWLIALDLVAAGTLPEHSQLNADYLLTTDQAVRERRSYQLESALDYRLQETLPDWLRMWTTRLPVNGNPRTRALAQQWRDESLSDEQIRQRALRMINQQAFVYTLEPASLGRDSVDDFLFTTREGYCEHYASAFTYLMRAAGIPARVVTGYLGGQRNPYGGYYVIRQSDAHAWSEIWLQGRGWVRVDPTAAVAPERIRDDAILRQSAQARINDYLAGRLSWGRLRYSMEARWDWVNAQWNSWVLAYGEERQRELLQRLGLGNWRRMILALTFGLTGLLAASGLWLARKTRPAPLRDRHLKLWMQLLRQLKRRGLEPRPGEGPRDFSRRAAGERPALAAPILAAAEAYLSLRYAGADDAQLEQVLARAGKALRLAPKRHRAWPMR